MIAILLCAGFGTRMYPLTKKRAKPLLPVAGRPLIDYLLDQFLGFPGLTAVHLVTNSRFWGQFEAWRREVEPVFKASGIRLLLHDDGAKHNEGRLGANGDLAFVLDRIEMPDGVLVAGGDNILRFELRPAWEAFRHGGRNLVLALAEQSEEKLRRSGVLVLDVNDRVIAFSEKPAEPLTRWLCPPFYFLNRAALAAARPFLGARQTPDAMGTLIRYLIDKVPIYAFKIEGDRLDVGSLDAYLKADEILSCEPVIRPPKPPVA